MSDIAFAAGYLEGEGHFRVRGNKPEIETMSVNPKILWRMWGLWGGNVHAVKHDGDPNHRQCWRWTLTGMDAVSLAKKLMESRLLEVKDDECRSVALCKDFMADTTAGDFLRTRAQEARHQEYRA